MKGYRGYPQYDDEGVCYMSAEEKAELRELARAEAEAVGSTVEELGEKFFAMMKAMFPHRQEGAMGARGRA